MPGNYQPIPDTDEDLVVEASSKGGLGAFSLVIVLFMFLGMGTAILLSLRKVNPEPVLTVESPIQIIQTSQFLGDRLSEVTAETLLQRGFNIPEKPLGFGNIDCNTDTTSSCANAAKVTVNSERMHQLILGFGGAFTEASAFNFFRLPKELQDNVTELYFGEGGIGYSMGRVHINSCDFALGNYDYAPVAGDNKLNYFDYSVNHDTLFLIPFITRAMKASKRGIKILASPWSAPAWMKEPVKGTQSMDGTAEPNGLINSTEVKNAWADYIVKWIFAFTWQGVSIWGITIQNEPKAMGPWEAMKMSDEFQRDFLNEFLGPQMDKSHPEVKIFIFDHNKNNMTAWVDTVAKREGNYKYISGVAFHWYSGAEDRAMDGTYGYDEVNKTHSLLPDKLLLATEGSSCPGVSIDDWFRAERFGHDVIFDMLSHTNGWLDWNLLLDTMGGPNHKQNYCDAPLIVSPDYSSVHIQPKFYYMGHFSKYIPPDSRRIASTVVGNFKFEKFDPRVRSGIEAGMYTCERSSRQMWKLTTDGLLALSVASKQDEEWQSLCVSGGINDRPFVRMVYCGVRTYSQPMQVVHMDETHLVEADSGLCIGLAGDSSDSGAMLSLSACDTNNPRQRFSVDSDTGEIKSEVGKDLCLTAGWPFLSGVSFFDGQDTTITVIMNEAPVDTEVVLHDFVRDEMTIFGINSRSIQTIIYK